MAHLTHEEFYRCVEWMKKQPDPLPSRSECVRRIRADCGIDTVSESSVTKAAKIAGKTIRGKRKSRPNTDRILRVAWVLQEIQDVLKTAGVELPEAVQNEIVALRHGNGSTIQIESRT